MLVIFLSRLFFWCSLAVLLVGCDRNADNEALSSRQELNPPAGAYVSAKACTQEDAACQTLVDLYERKPGFGMVSASQALLGAGVGFLIFLLPYVIGRMGAGDVKFLTVIGLYVGPVAVMKVALYAMLAGGVLALLLLCLRTARFIEGKNIPYAVGISIGALLVLAEMN